MKTRTLAAVRCLAPPLLGGCQSTEQWMASTPPKAIDAAEKRGRFDLNCPAAVARGS